MTKGCDRVRECEEKNRMERRVSFFTFKYGKSRKPEDGRQKLSKYTSAKRKRGSQINIRDIRTILSFKLVLLIDQKTED